MAWLVAIAIFVVAWLFVQGHRRTAAVVALGVVIVGVSLYFHYQRQEEIVTSRIAVSEIALEQVALKPTFRSSYDFTATLTNNSPRYRLDGIEIVVTLRDCAGNDESSCRVIGEASANTVVAVPPGESRHFVATLHFGGDQPQAKGRFAWDYEVVRTMARRQ